MSKTVKIPDCMSPFIVKVNGVKYVYPAGEKVEVPDDVAHVIEQHQAYHDAIEKVNSGEANPSGGGGDAADVAFLDLKKTITEYRDDTIVNLPVCAFCGCTNLKMVVLPKVEYIGYQELFEDCPNFVVADFTELKSLGEISWFNEVSWEVEYSSPLPKTTKALVNRSGLFTMGDSSNQAEIDGYGSDPSCGIAYTQTYVYIPREYIKAENFVGFSEDNYFYEYPNGADWNYIWKDTPERIRAIEDYTVDGTVTGALDFAKMGIE